MQVARIYCFGDSIMTGTYDPQGGWCDRFKQAMHRRTAESQDGTKRQVYNLGVGGETSCGLVQRIAAELEARHNPSWPAIVCIGIGKNDSRLKADGTPEVSLEEYEVNLRDCIAIAKKVTNKILLIGLGACAEESLNFKDVTYTRTRLKEYDDVMEKVAQELSIPRVPIYQLLADASKDAFYRDGLHPSEHGYQLIYEHVSPEIMKLLED